jgi:hypothetical protein
MTAAPDQPALTAHIGYQPAGRDPIAATEHVQIGDQQ